MERIERPLCSALSKLADFLMSAPTLPDLEPWVRRAVDTWFGDGERVQPHWEIPCFLGFLGYGFVDERGERGIDRLLRHQGAHLSAQERDALRTVLAHAYASLFEIEEVRLDVGLGFLDRVRGERIFVHEKLGTHGVSEGDFVLQWVVPIDGHLELTGASCLVPPAHLPTVEAAIAAALQGRAATAASPVPAGLVGEPLARVHRALREAVMHWNPQLVHPDGEQVVVARAIFETRAAEAVREKLAACPELQARPSGRFVRRQEGAVLRAEDLVEIELRTVRLSVQALSRRSLEEGKGLVKRLLGGLIQHRVDRFSDPLGRPLESLASPARAPRPGREPTLTVANDVEEALAGFHRHLDQHLLGDGTGASRPRPEAAPPVDPAARTHRLPPAAHEIMQALVPGLRELVGLLVTWQRRTPGYEARTLLPPELADVPPVQALLHEHAYALVARGWTQEDAASDANMLGAHLFYLVNFALHGKRTFWIDEALAWMLSETELDIIGRCLRLPFPAFAFVLTDPGSLELGESFLSEEEDCPLRGQPLRSICAYVTREEPSGEEEPQAVCVSFLFDARGDRWPYLVTRSLFIHPDQHLEAILDSRSPHVDEAARDPVFSAPELKKLVHLVINAILYATSAHLEPIVLSSTLGRLTRGMAGKGSKKRAELQRRAAALRGNCSGEDVFHLPGHIEISKLRRYREMQRTESGRTLMKRFMVRGHWRRPHQDWKDQRLRWIEPYWKGPELATVIEREYRLKP